MNIIKARSDFLRTARADHKPTKGFVLQARHRGDDDCPRVGFTCSKKVGNAVARNRAKRRLRAAARDVLAHDGRRGWDYVLIGRRGATAALPYERLCADLESALAAIHR